ncbi:unnamed protein product, partial [Phaeothamnion confervicola]
DPKQFKNAVNVSLRRLFGVVGLDGDADLIAFDAHTCMALMRLPGRLLVPWRAALTLESTLGETPCKFEVVHTSSTLMGMS